MRNFFTSLESIRFMECTFISSILWVLTMINHQYSIVFSFYFSSYSVGLRLHFTLNKTIQTLFIGNVLETFGFLISFWTQWKMARMMKVKWNKKKYRRTWCINFRRLIFVKHAYYAKHQTLCGNVLLIRTVHWCVANFGLGVRMRFMLKEKRAILNL